MYQLSVIAILEPFSDSVNIHNFKMQLSMDNATSNCNDKIWVFWNSDIDCNILDEDEQQITCDMKHNELQYQFTSTFIYAKCKDYLRRPLWDKMRHHASIITNPWCAVGDYNVISDVDEKLGGLPYNMRKSMDFIAVIEACGLVDIGFSGHKFTWSNKRGINHRIRKRLDRALVNDLWLEKMPQTTITHLSTTGSDHCPLLLEMVSAEANHINYFKFLNCWVDNPNFMVTVKNCWDRPVEGNAMWKFHQKMKRLSKTLSVWSRNEYGDIFQQVRMYEEQVHEAEEKYTLDQTDSNRSALHELNAQYIRFLKLEDNILKQKTQLHWFKDGDTNSKYFHSIIRGRRRKLFIHKIVNKNGDLIQGENNIAQAACEHFNSIFKGEDKYINEHTLECLPRLVNQDHNTSLTKLPSMDELKEVVFSMNPNSAAGPDGMNGGQMIPKYFSHSSVVLLPKVNNPNKLTEFRPISLSNFTSKIISKLVSNRLSPILPSLISANQSGFVKGRSISENIMLAQEIIHQIKKPNIGSNVIIKLDMAKAYDRVSWSYICLVLRKMGFNEVFIDMIWRIMANNWYSIIVNGKRYGFFHSTRGLKQGDPLSPTLFILSAEVLSRSLNRLHNHPDYHGFIMEKRGPQVNHLSFVDDIILFTSGRCKTLRLLMNTLKEYEMISGQLINGDKSHFMLHSNAFNSTRDRIKRLTSFKQKQGLINYLGCPLFVGRPRNVYFSDLINKVVSRITVAEFWENGEWNGSKLLQHAPASQICSILETEIQQQQHKPDQAVWKLTSHGRFTCSSAWEEIRDKKAKNIFNSFLWHKCIPFKSSFLLWRTLRGKIPTNERLANFGIEPSSCFCCFDRTGMDTIEHTFNTGQFAARVWDYFAATAGLQADHSTLLSLIKQWWTAKPKNAGHQLLMQATPIFICWNLWKNRCACKYGGKATNISRVKYAVYKDTFKMLKNTFPHINWPPSWTALIQKSEKCIHDIKVSMVKWIKPPDQWIKINTDGSALTNPGKIGAGGILRDKEGKLVMAFSTPLGEGSNNIAEIKAVFIGLTWALELGFRNIMLEIDSQLVVDWISNKAAPHWSTTSQLEKIQHIIMQTHNFKCSHIFREVNWVADALSKHSHNTTAPQVYFNSNQLPKEAKAYYQMDLMNMPSFRRKKTKKIFDPP
nr:uncharacterized protein LOC109119268 [Solanum lycopersicum]